METISLKALANKVLRGNKHRNIMEIPEDMHGNIVETSDGNIIGNMRYAVLLWSEVLQVHLWVVETDHDMHTLRTQNVAEPIYTGEEIRKLKGSTPEQLKAIHRVKEVFEKSIIEESTK